MASALKKGDVVEVSGMDTDTAFIEVDGKMFPVSVLKTRGKVVRVSKRPPGVEGDNADDESPSPHVLVSLPGPNGSEHELWVAESRVNKGE